MLGRDSFPVCFSIRESSRRLWICEIRGGLGTAIQRRIRALFHSSATLRWGNSRCQTAGVFDESANGEGRCVHGIYSISEEPKMRCKGRIEIFQNPRISSPKQVEWLVEVVQTIVKRFLYLHEYKQRFGGAGTSIMTLSFSGRL